MLVKVLAGAAAALILFFFFVSSRPAAYRVERKLDVAVPPDRVFAVLTQIQKLAAIAVLFGEPLPEGTVAGDAYTWKGGSLTLAERFPNQKVTAKLAFTEPMESKADWTFGLAPAGTGAAVTWSIEGNHNFLGKVAGLFIDMDKALGGDLELGLAKLKSAAEAK